MPPQRRGALARLQILDNWIVAANDPARTPQRLPPSRNNRATSRIPAANTLDRSQLQAVRFRGDFPAASLKRSSTAYVPFASWSIPRGLPRGLIEAWTRRFRLSMAGRFRGDFPAASLKLDPLPWYQASRLCDSAGTSPRPH